MTFTTLHRNNRQKGMALLIAIGMLALLSILGAVIMDVSTRELSDSALTLPNLRAFQTADRAAEYAMNRDILVNMPQYNSVDLMTHNVILSNGTEVVDGDGNYVTHKKLIESTGVGKLLAPSKITDMGPRSLPPAMAASYGSEFGANLYHLTVKSEAGAGPYKRTTHVDANIVRLFKLDDDQIFRTSGGG